jgi:heavy metal sensor kinase
MSLKIRWRLTLWNLLALGVVLLGFATLVYGLVARTLYQQLDRKLLAGFQQAEQDSRLAGDRDERLRHWIYELKEHENVFCVVYGPRGEVMERTVELAADSVPAAPLVGENVPRWHDAAVPIIGRQRVLETQLHIGGQDHPVILMASLEEVEHELAHLVTALALAVPVGLVLCSGVSYLLARKALAPVEQLRRMTREITAEKLDRRLTIANADDELGRLARTINEMIGRLERSFAEIRRFTADASHELRTPLTAIRTETEVALNKSELVPEQQQLLGSILEECDRLTRLTDQLLMLSREDATVVGQASEPVELTSLLVGAVETMRPLAEVKGICLSSHTRPVPPIRGDAARLRQVCYNLLDNAIKYTPEGCQIDVSVAELQGGVAITVRDTGIGIPAEHLPHVFDRFYRVDKARSREQGGTGLGLSIAQSIVAAHGGQIELSSTPGKGTTCTVRLAAERAQ